MKAIIIILFVIGFFAVVAYNRFAPRFFGKDPIELPAGNSEVIPLEDPKSYFFYQWKNPPMPSTVFITDLGLKSDPSRNLIFGNLTSKEISKASSILSSIDKPVFEVLEQDLADEIEIDKIVTEPEIELLPIPEQNLDPVYEYIVYEFQNVSISEVLATHLQTLGLQVDREDSRAFGKVLDKDISLIFEHLESLDQAPESVTVEGRFLNCTLSESDDFSFSWFVDVGAIQGLRNFNINSNPGIFSVSSEVFSATLEAGRRNGDISVLSSPTIGLLVGQEGRLSSGREVGIVSTQVLEGSIISDIEYKRVAYELTITVNHYRQDEVYRLSISQRSDEIIGTREIGGNPVPEIGSDLIDSTVIIPEGRWLLIGGLSRSVKQDEKQRSRLPFISRSRQRNTSKVETVLALRVSSGLQLQEKPSAYAKKL